VFTNLSDLAKGLIFYGVVLVLGALDLLLGFGAFVWPGVAAPALLWPAAVTIWAVLGGSALVLAAGHVKPLGTGRLLLRATGLVAVVFGVALAVVALPGMQPIVWLVSGYAFTTGALLLGAAVGVVQTSTTRDQPAD
jgi:hypothetical protein